MKTLHVVITTLLLSNVLAVVAELHSAGSSWISYVNLFGVVLFGYYVHGWRYWDGK